MATPSSDVSITREQLTKYFHLPITDVAKELGICATMLKKICRKNGIPRWPHRKIKSLNKMIESLEASLPNDGSEAGECIRQEIIILKNKKSLIMRNPSILVQGSSNKRPSIEGDEGTPVPSSKKQRVEPEAPVVTTFVNPKPFPPPSSSTANSFSINQLLTAPTSFSTPLTSGAMDEKDPYRSPYHAPAHQLHSYSEYKDTKHLSTPPSFSSPLTSYLPPEEDDHARHGDGHPPPSPPPFPSSHPADPYYYHKAALAYQYQYHRQFSSIPQHQQPITQHPYGYPPSQQQQGSPRTSYTSPYHSLANMPQQQLLPPSQSQPQQQQSQQQEQQSQQQQQTTQQSQQAQAQQNQAKPQQTQQQQQPQPSPQKQQAAVPAQKPGSSEALPPLKFRPPSPSSSHPPASFAPPPSEMAYYYSHPHFQSQGYPPQAIPRHPNN